jgi:hypothetical protein
VDRLPGPACAGALAQAVRGLPAASGWRLEPTMLLGAPVALDQNTVFEFAIRLVSMEIFFFRNQRAPVPIVVK